MDKKKKMSYTLFIEKYRPDCIKNVILPTHIKSFLVKLVEEKEIPNLLFYSSKPGTGKTTTAKALVNEIGSDYIYINMSSERGLDVLRDRIAKFATSYSMFGENRGGKKICILDEFDGSTPALQSALRAFMEEFQDSCRFILTCNYATKIIEPLKSRCQLIDFNMSDKKSQKELVPKVVQRLCGMLKHEGITFKVETVEKVVKTFYPDIRRMMGLLQQYSKQNKNIDSGIFDYEKVDTELYEMILNKQLTNARKFIIERNYNFDEMFRSFFDNFVPMLDKGKQGQAILIISEFMFKNSFVIDKEINFTACLLEIISIL